MVNCKVPELNCKKKATYGYEYKKGLRCGEHRIDGMENVVKDKCKCGNSLSPCFGNITDKKPEYCSKCKTDDMVELAHSKEKCPCNIRATFGFPGEKAECCKNCMKFGMIDLMNDNLRCECGTIAVFGINADKNATHCAKCKTPEMFNVKSKMCFCGRVQPTFGLDKNKSATHCKECKTPEMFNVKKKMCFCGKVKPSFGLDVNKLPTHCTSCKTPEMIKIIKMCFCGKVIPSYGLYIDKPATHCKKCKTKEMFNVKNKMCFCGKVKPSFGLDKNKPATHCKECKTPEMFDVTNKMCFCGKVQPTFGLKNGKITHCYNCKTPEMINLKNTFCIAVDKNGVSYCQTTGNIKYRGYCANCFANLFPSDPLTLSIRKKTKEIAVRDFINKNFEGFQHDIPLWTNNCDCTHRRRIDHRKLIGNTLLCIETDENSHKYYNKEDEEIRYDDVMMLHGGKFIFIRFNPDKYIENGISKNPQMKTRLDALQKEIEKQIKRIENNKNTELLEIVYMYYNKNNLLKKN